MRALAVLTVAATLAGCADTDPYMKPGAWQPVGANAINLAAMLQNPKDLVRGHGEKGFSGVEAVPPVGRLWTGKTAPLPSSASQSGPTGPASAAPGGTGF